MWREFGLVALPPNVAVAQLDPRADVIQLAGVALSMLLARPVTLDDLRHRLPKLLDEFSELSPPASAHHIPPLRLWLERALQLNGTSYASAAEAEQDLKELPTGLPSSTVATPAVRLVEAAKEAPRPVAAPPPQAPEGRARTERAPDRSAFRQPAAFAGAGVDDPGITDLFPRETRTSDSSPRPPTSAPQWPEHFQRVGLQPERRRTRNAREQSPKPPPVVRRRWLPRVTTVATTLAAIAVLEAAVIALMGKGMLGRAAAVVIESQRPGDTVFVNGEAVGPTPFQLRVGSDVRSVSVVPASPPARGPVTEAATASTSTKGVVRDTAAPTAQQKPGGSGSSRRSR